MRIPDSHFTAVTNAFRRGRLIAFLGAGVNLCDRPDSVSWNSRTRNCLPNGSELAEYIREEFGCDCSAADLARVSQYVAVTEGPGPLYGQLHGIFDHDYEPTSIHRLLASLPAALRQKGYPSSQLIVTTNYDDVLERAFAAAGESIDVVTYVADPPHQRGKFLHIKPGEKPFLIDVPNQYRDLALGERSTVLKIHGTVVRNTATADDDSYVITEDHYIDYLARTDLAKLIPTAIVSQFSRSNFLFLGYGLRDWNLRVILNRIWGEQKLAYASWAIQLHPDDLDRRFWMRRGVEILEAGLSEYGGALKERIETLAPA